MSSRNCNAIDNREPIDYPEENIMPSEQEWKIDLMNWDAGDVPRLRSDDRKWTLQPGKD